MNKKEFTKLFLEQAGIDASDNSVKMHMPLMWVTPRSPIGLQMTYFGHNFLKSQLKLQSYMFTIKEDFQRNLKIILRMNKYLTGPFYLPRFEDTKSKSIIMYGEQDAFMMGMMGGDLEQYLDNFTRE